MVRKGKALAVAWLAAACMPAIATPAQKPPTQQRESAAQSAAQSATLYAVPVSPAALDLVDRVTRAGDHETLPFAVVDKRQARIYVFDPAGRLQGTSAALLGQASGDDSAPDVGEHAQTGDVPPAERTTPAGRFVSQPGRNRAGEPVIWVDYDSAFAIHRVRPGRSLKTRLALLESSSPQERRVSLGCVVVPVRFYEQVVHKWLGQGRSVVYVLPENETVQHDL